MNFSRMAPTGGSVPSLSLTVMDNGDNTATLTWTDAERTGGTYLVFFNEDEVDSVAFDADKTSDVALDTSGPQEFYVTWSDGGDPVLSNTVTIHRPVAALTIESAPDDGSTTAFNLSVSWSNPAGYTDTCGLVEILVNDIAVYTEQQVLNDEALSLNLPGSPGDAVEIVIHVTGTVDPFGYPSLASTDSATVTALSTVATPTVAPNGGSFNNNETITLASATGGTTFYYTTDGTTPTTSSTLYSGTFSHGTSGVIKVLAVKAGFYSAAVVTSSAFTYTVGAITPGVATGTYNNDVSATFSVATTTGATKEYSLDGVTWSAYGSGQTISASTTYYMRATKTGYTSATANATYTLAVGAITPVTAAGTFNNDFTADFNVATTSGATKEYSFDNATWNALGAGASITASNTFYMRATKAGYTTATDSAVYVMQVGAITPGFATNTYNNDFTATFSVATTTGSTKEYSYDNAAWNAYGSGQTIDQTRTYYMRATKTGYTSATASAVYTMKCATPTFGTNGGSFSNDTTTTITSSTTSSAISYSGAATGVGSTTNGGTVAVTGSGTIAAVATKLGYTDSDTATSSTFTFTVGAITPGTATGTFNNDFTATFTVATTTGATKEYSYDNASWSAYGSGQTIDQTRTYYMRATKTGYTSATANRTYTMEVGAITPGTANGTYNADFTATASIGTTTGATAYYSFDNVTFSSLGAGVSIDRTRTVYFEGRKTGYTSSTANRAYTMQVATPTFSPVAGSYSSTQNITVSTTTSGANGYYTTNGVDPTTGSTAISGTIPISATTTLKALMARANWTNSAVGSAVYDFGDSDAQAWITALSSAGYTMTSNRQTITHNYFIALKAQTSISNIKTMVALCLNNATYNVVPMYGAAPVFTAGSGTVLAHASDCVTTNGTNAWIRSHAISAANGYGQHTVGFGYRLGATTRSGDTFLNDYDGCYNSTVGGALGNLVIFPRRTGTSNYYSYGQTDIFDTTSGSYGTAGFYGMNKTLLASTSRHSINGSGTVNSVTSATSNPFSLPDVGFGMGARNREGNTPDLFFPRSYTGFIGFNNLSHATSATVYSLFDTFLKAFIAG